MSAQDDDQILLRELRAGKEENMNLLLEKYKPLVKDRAKAYFLLGGEQDDLMQEGMIGLFYAVETYDFQSNVPFSSFADLLVRRRLCTAIARAARKKHGPLNSYISLYEKKVSAEGEDLPCLAETLVDCKEENPEKVYFERRYVELVKERIEKELSPMEKQVFYLSLQGNDYREIASLLNKKDKSIDNALQRIRQKVRALQKQGAL